MFINETVERIRPISELTASFSELTTSFSELTTTFSGEVSHFRS